MTRQSHKKSAPQPKGARRTEQSWQDQLRAWQLHHRASARDAWQRLLKAPVATFMTVLVIAIALALPAGLSVLLTNAQQATQDWDGNAHLSVFLKQQVSTQAQNILADTWRERDDIQRVEVISSEQALAEFKALSGFGDALDALPENPFATWLRVYPDSTDAIALEKVSQELEKAEGVDLVQLDVLWVKLLHAMLEAVGRIVSVLTLALAVAVVLVVV